ncbi:Kelch domain-containing protein 5 [Chelonia mydas]|uniref:Kelch domain-containing protein 5 n=1 Tax=Chelonia mydas TaxID=8469 RepID=M7BRU5_CHEMY|nr:Kelch domain-containing protein 5 [Chelonia mydas]
MPNPLAEFSACECKGKIYVVGGYTTRDRNMNILQYCPISDCWTNFELCDVHIRKQQMLSVEETIYLGVLDEVHRAVNLPRFFPESVVVFETMQI